MSSLTISPWSVTAIILLRTSLSSARPLTSQHVQSTPENGVATSTIVVSLFVLVATVATVLALCIGSKTPSRPEPRPSPRPFFPNQIPDQPSETLTNGTQSILQHWPPTELVGSSKSTLRLEEDTLQGIVAFLREVLARTEGRFHAKYVMTSEPPRVFEHCVTVGATFSYGRAVEFVFFPKPKPFDKFKKLFKLDKFRDGHLPVTKEINIDTSLTTHHDKESGLNVELPLHIVTEQTESYVACIKPLVGLRKSVMIFSMHQGITEQLVQLHSKKIVHRGVTRQNIVYASECQNSWTFRDYSGFSIHDRPATAIPESTPMKWLPPEAAKAHALGGNLQIVAQVSMDIWQLGVLLFECLSDTPYWNLFTDAEVYDTLISSASLPHHSVDRMDEIGTSPDLIGTKQLIAEMISRDASQRPTATEVLRRLAAQFESIRPDARTIFGQATTITL